ncbi:hypothetical protein Hanom_Chr07g00623111 [Helianthus anomalus]
MCIVLQRWLSNCYYRHKVTQAIRFCIKVSCKHLEIRSSPSSNILIFLINFVN